MSVTKCMCLGRPLAPGSDRAWSIIYFITTFIPNNHVITTFWDALLFSLPFDNQPLRTIILNVYYCIYFTKFVSSLPAHEANRSGSNHL
ncbi:hypothetical protein HID58_036525 [Brassica napus]|uniref:Rab-GAP TBC domain-containing protein n=1 Tax=Brassica napus TaxID=3708 RepID=A0ABQ8C7Z5_BRANA|nr:hypothetical protein HID58_036525 [Brassica napus]